MLGKEGCGVVAMASLKLKILGLPLTSIESAPASGLARCARVWGERAYCAKLVL